MVFYIVEVYTGSVKYAGTDANVYINIFGELGDTGQRWLKHPVSSNINKFEKGQVNYVIVLSNNLAQGRIKD